MPKDRLWVRETWRTNSIYDNDKPSLIPSSAPIEYAADHNKKQLMAGKNRPSIFMPRWASRIDLEIIGIRVERLQDISEADAIAEGIIRHGVCSNTGLFHNYIDSSTGFIDPRDSYQSLWQSINGQESWEANPWVWVIEFKKLEEK
jgi:hypothetical protein